MSTERVINTVIVLAAVIAILCLLPVLSRHVCDIPCSNRQIALAGTSPPNTDPKPAPNTDNRTGEQRAEPGAAEDTALGRPQPEITLVEIFSDPGCTQPVQSLTPQTTYYARVDVRMRMGNQLSQLREVRVTVFYDSAGTNPPPPPVSNPQTCAILLCNIDRPPLWDINAGSPTSWQILPDQCQQPDLTKKSGTWVFAFKPGKVATASPPGNWDVCAKATSKFLLADELCVRNKAMNWYGEITFSAGLLDWGEVQPGLRFEDMPPNPRSLTATYIANGSYGVDIKSGDWSGGATTIYLDETGGNPPAGEMQFALKMSTAGNLSDAITIRKSYTPIGNGTQTGEGGVASTNTFYLSLTESDIPAETYSGTISYLITPR